MYNVDENIKISLHQISEINKALKFLSSRNQEESPAKAEVDGLEIVESIKSLNEEINAIEQEQLVLNKDIQKAEPWGDFDPNLQKSTFI